MERRRLFLAHSYEFTERLGGSPVYSEFPGSELGSETDGAQKRVPMEVSRIGGKAAKLLGIVYARDEEQAFQKAVEDLGKSRIHTSKIACSFDAPLTLPRRAHLRCSRQGADRAAWRRSPRFASDR